MGILWSGCAEKRARFSFTTGRICVKLSDCRVFFCALPTRRRVLGYFRQSGASPAQNAATGHILGKVDKSYDPQRRENRRH